MEKEINKEVLDALDEMVKEGKLVKIYSAGEIGWIDSRSKQPKGSKVLDGSFK